MHRGCKALYFLNRHLAMASDSLAHHLGFHSAQACVLTPLEMEGFQLNSLSWRGTEEKSYYGLEPWGVDFWCIPAVISMYFFWYFPSFGFVPKQGKAEGKEFMAFPCNHSVCEKICRYIYVYTQILVCKYINKHTCLHTQRKTLAFDGLPTNWYLLLLIECILLIDMVKSCSYSYNQILTQ